MMNMGGIHNIYIFKRRSHTSALVYSYVSAMYYKGWGRNRRWGTGPNGWTYCYRDPTIGRAMSGRLVYLDY